MTVSEGVGTGIYTNRQLARGLNGMAGEFGHVPLDPNGPSCRCGGRGCWEVYASNRAALRYYHESTAVTEGPTFQHLLALGQSGDALALKALDRMAHAIGKGMRMIVAGLAPEEIVLVGEFAGLWQRLGPIIEAEVAAAILIGKPPRVRPAAEPGDGAVARDCRSSAAKTFCSFTTLERQRDFRGAGKECGPSNITRSYLLYCESGRRTNSTAF